MDIGKLTLVAVCAIHKGEVIMADELHVELERLGELAATFDSAVQGVGGVTVNVRAPEVAAALGSSATGGACHAGGNAAQAALKTVTDHYRTLHKGTRTSADSYESCDTEHGRRIDTLRKAL